MFTDIAGYTAMMSADENKALQVLQKNRDTLKPVIEEYDGTLLKEMGDGTVSSFSSAVDAVNCAIEIQNQLKEEPDFKIRIGIHIGDVVIAESDIFGDGVNVASRIEPLAEPGGICISGRVYDDIRNQPDINTLFIGEKKLKNVDRPMQVYAITGEDLPTPQLETSMISDVTDRGVKGTTISHYAIMEKIGEGGMGVVYKAEDTSLKRTVALKFLRPEILGNEEQKTRFIKEAQAAAALNHPNICTVYEINEAEGRTFIAMEYIDGQSLAEKIAWGPLKLKKAVEIANQVSEGLQAAHEHGIIHRDIKSANVMVTEKGQVKIMDFGLARMATSSTLTREGTALGTIAYMSPEQAKGEKVDHRTDIWALGVMLFEMVTGQLPFKGDQDQAIVYSILNDEPEPLTALRTGVPIELDRIVAKAMAKSPGSRYQHVDEFPVDLSTVEIVSTGSTSITAASIAPSQVPSTIADKFRTTPAITAMLVIAFAFGGIIIGIFSNKEESPIILTTKFSISPTDFGLSGALFPIISPDGTTLVFNGFYQGREGQLFRRAIDQLSVIPIPGTSGATGPFFFSLDGRYICFTQVEEGLLVKLLLAGGSPIPICELNSSNGGGSWGKDGTIVFADVLRPGNPMQVLREVSSVAGTPRIIAMPDTTNGEVGHAFPSFLPDGRRILFTILFQGDPVITRIALMDLETGEYQILLNEEGYFPQYVSSGHILYVRRPGLLMAMPFDPKTGTVTGSPEQVLEDVLFLDFKISDNGTLAYNIPATEDPQLAGNGFLMRVTREGEQTQVTEEARSYRWPRLSPDGNWIAVVDRNPTRNAWIYDMEYGTFSPFTFVESVGPPVWTPDGSRIVYSSRVDGVQNLYWKSSTGSGEEELLWSTGNASHAVSCSPDGILAWHEINLATSRDLWVLDLESKTATEFYVTEFNKRSPMFSPDGKWIAYMSNESGSINVWVQPYPSTGAKWQISTEGGWEPRWGSEGSELFYRSNEGMMAVPIETEPRFRKGISEVLFPDTYVSGGNITGYDYDPVSDTFIMIGQVSSQEETVAWSSINIHINWLTELERRMRPPDN